MNLRCPIAFRISHFAFYFSKSLFSFSSQFPLVMQSGSYKNYTQLHWATMLSGTVISISTSPSEAHESASIWIATMTKAELLIRGWMGWLAWAVLCWPKCDSVVILNNGHWINHLKLSNFTRLYAWASPHSTYPILCPTNLPWEVYLQ